MTINVLIAYFLTAYSTMYAVCHYECEKDPDGAGFWFGVFIISPASYLFVTAVACWSFSCRMAAGFFRPTEAKT